MCITELCYEDECESELATTAATKFSNTVCHWAAIERLITERSVKSIVDSFDSAIERKTAFFTSLTDKCKSDDCIKCSEFITSTIKFLFWAKTDNGFKFDFILYCCNTTADSQSITGELAWLFIFSKRVDAFTAKWSFK